MHSLLRKNIAETLSWFAFAVRDLLLSWAICFYRAWFAFMNENDFWRPWAISFCVTVVGHRMREFQEPAEFSGAPVIPISSLWSLGMSGLSWPGIKEYILTKSSAAKCLEQIAEFLLPTWPFQLLSSFSRLWSITVRKRNKMKGNAFLQIGSVAATSYYTPIRHFKALFCTKPNSVTLSSPNKRDRVPG